MAMPKPAWEELGVEDSPLPQAHGLLKGMGQWS